jgi:hypothetical protein
MVTVHFVEVVVQLPVHPEKKKFVPGAAVSMTCVFCLKLAEHVPGQLMPDGLLVIFPDPAAGAVIVS